MLPFMSSSDMMLRKSVESNEISRSSKMEESVDLEESSIPLSHGLLEAFLSAGDKLSVVFVSVNKIGASFDEVVCEAFKGMTKDGGEVELSD